MVNLKKMQSNIDKLMSVFTNLVNALDSSIAELETEISVNNNHIAKLHSENAVMVSKIDEYESLKNRVESIVK
jgi:uncharacterized protein YdcH (DUF465 family)